MTQADAQDKTRRHDVTSVVVEAQVIAAAPADAAPASVIALDASAVSLTPMKRNIRWSLANNQIKEFHKFKPIQLVTTQAIAAHLNKPMPKPVLKRRSLQLDDVQMADRR